MKILVISDTHESTRELEKIIELHAEEVKIVCHLGDHARDLLQFQSRWSGLAFVAVAGNCDYEPGLQREAILSLSPCLDSDKASVNILLAHGHTMGVKAGVDRLAYFAREKGARAAFFGHTHVPVITERGGVFIMNPGSPAFPRGGSRPSYGIVEISADGEIFGEILYYEE